jgi:anti-anti-sigma factor
MSLHVLSHPWKVQQVKDGTLIRITRQDLDVTTVSVLAHELFELAQESGQPQLYLDFADVSFVPTVLLGKLLALDRQLHAIGGRLVLCGLNPEMQELFELDGLPAGPAG